MALAVDNRTLPIPGLASEAIPELSDAQSAFGRAADQRALRVDRSGIAAALQTPFNLPDREGVRTVGISDAIGSYDRAARQAVDAMPGAEALPFGAKIELATATAEVMKHHATGLEGSERNILEPGEEQPEQAQLPPVEEAIAQEGLITAEPDAAEPHTSSAITIEEDSFEGLRLSAAGIVPLTNDIEIRDAFARSEAQALGLEVSPQQRQDREALEHASNARQEELLAALEIELGPRAALSHSPLDAEPELVAA
ncbi:MAG: hypothetical protein K1X83_07175 [Oligoflexia bacterium]|nr:hypothetical protein [Oligoflexia bacterium]